VSITGKRLASKQGNAAIERVLCGALLLGVALWSGAAAAAAPSSLLTDNSPAPMNIDILPGNDENTINLGSQRFVAVAILGSADFDINDFNPRTLKLKAVDQNLVGKSDKTMCKQQDINGDSYMDLVCDIKTIGFRVTPGEIAVIISAGTYQKQSLRAEGVIRYVTE